MKVGASNTAWVGYYSPLPAAEPLIDKIDPNVYRYVPSQQLINDKGAFYDDLGAFAEIYTNAWTQGEERVGPFFQIWRCATGEP